MKLIQATQTRTSDYEGARPRAQRNALSRHKFYESLLYAEVFNRSADICHILSRPGESKWAQVNSSESKWVQVSPSELSESTRIQMNSHVSQKQSCYNIYGCFSTGSGVKHFWTFYDVAKHPGKWEHGLWRNSPAQVGYWIKNHIVLEIAKPLARTTSL